VRPRLDWELKNANQICRHRGKGKWEATSFYTNITLDKNIGEVCDEEPISPIIKFALRFRAELAMRAA
jgi:hypothetical protein